ncbi:bacillithiol system redox-active protein YtxJ [Candidatus Latescibacterota bacterium]
MAEIKKVTTLSAVIEVLAGKRVVIFKHSTRCPISAAARRCFEAFARSCDDGVNLYEVDVIAERAISDEITKRTGVTHHTPEVLFIRDGVVTGYHTHYDIREETLEKGIEP